MAGMPRRSVDLYSYTVTKSFSRFPSQAGMSLTKLSLGGNYDVIYKLFQPRESLVSDIPAGGGEYRKVFFYIVVRTVPTPPFGEPKAS